MKTILSTKQLAPFLAILIIHLLLQANSASIEPDPGAEISGRNRKLRMLPSAPPSPELDRGAHYFDFAPPPPETRRTARNLRAARKGSPPTPMVSRPRNFRIFPSPPIQRRSPPPPPLAVAAGPPTNCNLVPPPPESY